MSLKIGKAQDGLVHRPSPAITVLSAFLLFTAIPSLTRGAAPRLNLPTNQVPCQCGLEFLINWPASYTNPFNPAEVQMDLQVTHASGEQFRMPAFYLQDYERKRSRETARGPAWLYPSGYPSWRARFAPILQGYHQAVVRVKDATGEHLSAPVEFTATAAASPGYVQVSREDPRFLELRTVGSKSPGKPFFPIGQNLAFIGVSQYVSLDHAEEVFAKLATNGANYLRIWTCCQDWAIAIEASKSAFGRSWGGRPQIVPCPGDPTRSCLQLSRTNTTIRVDPSHRVALKSSQDYQLTGRWRNVRAGLRLEVHGQSAELQAPTGEWRPFSFKFKTGPNERWLGNVALALEGDGDVWVADLSLKEAGGSVELLWEADLNRGVRGVYNQPDCFMVDELVRAAERDGLYLQLCLLTRDLYMNRLQDPASAEYAEAVQDAKNFMRYTVGRWGYSTAVATWEYWNEMDPGKPTDRFYAEVSEYLANIDIYGHLKSTSTWGPSARDCRLSALSLADTHFYLRPADADRLENEVHAVLDRALWIRQQAPRKPALLGEFGIADNQWRLLPEMNRKTGLADVHNALWASALSGLSGTALSWWWERLDQQEIYSLYRPLSQFLKDIPWTTGQLERAEVTSTNSTLRLVGLQSRGDEAWFWIFHNDAAWKARVEGQLLPKLNEVEIEVKGLKPGAWNVEWFNTHRGEVARIDKAQMSGGTVKLRTPAFEGDLACKLSRR